MVSVTNTLSRVTPRLDHGAGGRQPVYPSEAQLSFPGLSLHASSQEGPGARCCDEVVDGETAPICGDAFLLLLSGPGRVQWIS